MIYRAASYWIYFVVISLCSVGTAVAGGAGSSNLQHSALAFRTDTLVPLDGDLTKCRGADTVTLQRNLWQAILVVRPEAQSN
jgi:hypothetical protein